ncbi:uncharacterized protein LOC114538038 [Dendronephthya gigantea]|uniref:uncharacterized protein LOC114538038 n=1 Tax=Dendronephthya gigantea TaxID=151771 RepID=UPI00106B15C8|nr:uncharacterized protein LOC114538038 [Dendronephthya gigantea]
MSEFYLEDGNWVKNISGSGDERPRGSRFKTWKQFYIGHNGRTWPRYCCIDQCMERADGGGHVNIQGRRGAFIVPMCDRLHNTAQNMEWLPVREGTIALHVDNHVEEAPIIEDNSNWCAIS